MQDTVVKYVYIVSRQLHFVSVEDQGSRLPQLLRQFSQLLAADRASSRDSLASVEAGDVQEGKALSQLAATSVASTGDYVLVRKGPKRTAASPLSSNVACSSSFWALAEDGNDYEDPQQGFSLRDWPGEGGSLESTDPPARPGASVRTVGTCCRPTTGRSTSRRTTGTCCKPKKRSIGVMACIVKEDGHSNTFFATAARHEKATDVVNTGGHSNTFLATAARHEKGDDGAKEGGHCNTFHDTAARHEKGADGVKEGGHYNTGLDTATCHEKGEGGVKEGGHCNTYLATVARHERGDDGVKEEGDGINTFLATAAPSHQEHVDNMKEGHYDKFADGTGSLESYVEESMNYVNVLLSDPMLKMKLRLAELQAAQRGSDCRASQ